MTTFSDHLQQSLGLSPRTVQSYGETVALWRVWLAGRPETSQGAVAWLSSFPAFRTRNTYAAALRQYFRWRYPETPLNIKVKMAQSVPNPQPLENVKHILFIAQPEHRLVILLLAFGGLRLEELCQVKVGDFSADAPTLRVKGKGMKERTVKLPRELLVRLRQQINGRKLGWLFPGQEKGEHIGATTVQHFLSRYGRMVGAQNLHPHRLRHFFGSWLYALTRDPFYVARQMGHSDPKVTFGYVGLVEPPLGITSMDELYRYLMPFEPM